MNSFYEILHAQFPNSTSDSKHFSSQKLVSICLFVLFERMPPQWKKNRYPIIRVLLHVLRTEQTSYFPMQDLILKPRVPEIKPSAWHKTMQPCGPLQIGIQSALGGIWVYTLPPGDNPCIVQNLCRPFQAFSWFPIQKTSSNSTVPVSWITEPITDFWLVVSIWSQF